MGDQWLLWLPDYLSAEGLNVRTWDGWQTRSRSSGGFDDLQGLVAHHTVSTSHINDDARFCWENSGDRPIGTMLLGRDGECLVGTAGASNTNGKGGPRSGPNGLILQDNANRTCPAIEGCNDGVGEPWPVAQQDAYVLAMAAMTKGILAEHGIDLALGGPFAHREWAPDRKFDPAGPSKWATRVLNTHGAPIWDMNAFRADVFSALLEPIPPDPEPEEEDVANYVALYKGKLYQGDRQTAKEITWDDVDTAIEFHKDPNRKNPPLLNRAAEPVLTREDVKSVDLQGLRWIGGRDN